MYNKQKNIKNSFSIHFQYWNIYNIRVLYIQYLIHNSIVAFIGCTNWKFQFFFPFIFQFGFWIFFVFVSNFEMQFCFWSVAFHALHNFTVISPLFAVIQKLLFFFYRVNCKFRFFKGFLLDWFTISLLLFSSCQNCNALSERECYIKSVPIPIQSYISYPEILLQWLDIFQ